MIKVHFVGAGPGDPELITVKGKALLEKADVIIYAGSLVNPALLQWAKKDAAIYNSASMTLEEIILVIKDAASCGRETVRLHTGDGSLYGAIREQMDALEDAGIAFDIVPGVSSLFAAAAALRSEYTLPGISQSLIITRCEGRTPVPERERLAALASHGTSMAIFLSSGLVREVEDALAGAGLPPETPAAIVSRASWHDEQVFRGTVGGLSAMVERAGITKTALILVGKFLDGKGGRSLLYDAAFSHEYRSSLWVSPAPPALAAPLKPAAPYPIIIIAVSAAGAALAESIAGSIGCAEVYTAAQHVRSGQEAFKSIFDITQKLWSETRSFIFISAAGIAVRAIAPLVRSKHTDPAVVCCADNGAFVISLLSGHEGGANALAARVHAALPESLPVITTASEASPAVLPRNLAAGIGCKRGIDAAALKDALNDCLAKNSLSPLRLFTIASIDIKNDEPAVLALAAELGAPCVFFTAEELSAAQGDFYGSKFVKDAVGVDNVCERSASLACGGGRLLVQKTVFDGITIAIAERTI